jgi:hypothetical protein
MGWRLHDHVDGADQRDGREDQEENHIHGNSSFVGQAFSLRPIFNRPSDRRRPNKGIAARAVGAGRLVQAQAG